MDRRFLRHFAQYVTHSHLLSQQFQLLHSATFHAASLLRAATLHTVPLFRAATRPSASTQTVTFSHDKRCNQKSPVRFSHYLCHIRESASSAHHHSVTPRRLPPCATIPAARILYPPHGSTPRADTTIHNRQPSATLECVTRCLTFSVASTTEKLPSSNGTFLDVHSTYSGLCICIECVFADILIYIHRHP